MTSRPHGVAVHLFLWLAIVFLVGCLAPPAIMVYWALDRHLPLTALSARFAGWDGGRPNTALVEWTGVRHRSCPGTAYRWLVGDGRVWPLPAELVPYAGSTETFEGGASRWVVAVTLPADATESGPTAYRVNFEWECNPLHRWWPVTFTAEDVPFPSSSPPPAGPPPPPSPPREAPP